jgi:hypothetical protein
MAPATKRDKLKIKEKDLLTQQLAVILEGSI